MWWGQYRSQLCLRQEELLPAPPLHPQGTLKGVTWTNWGEGTPLGAVLQSFETGTGPGPVN